MQGRSFIVCFCQVFQGLRLFKGLLLFRTLEYLDKHVCEQNRRISCINTKIFTIFMVFSVDNFSKRQKDLKYFHIDLWNGWFPSRTIEYWRKKVFFILHQFLNFMPIFWSTEVSIVIPNINYLKIQFYTVHTRDVSKEVTTKFWGTAFYTEKERQLEKIVLLSMRPTPFKNAKRWLGKIHSKFCF